MQDNNTDFDKTIECIRQRKEIFARMDERPFPSGAGVPDPVEVIRNMRDERDLVYPGLLSSTE